MSAVAELSRHLRIAGNALIACADIVAASDEPTVHRDAKSCTTSIQHFGDMVASLDDLKRRTMCEFGPRWDDCDDALWEAIEAGAAAIKSVPGYTSVYGHCDILAEKVKVNGTTHRVLLTESGIEYHYVTRDEPEEWKEDVVATRDTVNLRMAEASGQIGEYPIGNVAWMWGNLVDGLRSIHARLLVWHARKDRSVVDELTF